MILFIFEGKKQEPRIFETIKYLFFDKDSIHISYCSNIFSLYRDMKKLDSFDTIKTDYEDILTVLKNRIEKDPSSNDVTLLKYKNDDFQEIYLFFDYDIQKPNKINKKTLHNQNENISQMLNYFDDETRRGKLYINYPMFESIRYFRKELPDERFFKYTSYIFLQRKFKEKVHRISFYKDMRFIAFDYSNNKLKLPKNRKGEVAQEVIDKVKSNWKFIKKLNVKKANYICCGINSFPEKKTDISQIKIFENQKKKYINKFFLKRVAILNAFPLFLYEYFK